MRAPLYFASGSNRPADIGANVLVPIQKGRLFEDGPGKFSVRFHSNAWVTMQAAK